MPRNKVRRPWLDYLVYLFVRTLVSFAQMLTIEQSCALAEFAAIDSAPTGKMMSNMRWTAGSHQGMARRLDPSLPEPYYVDAFNGYRHGAEEALSIIDEGLRRNPDSALLFDGRRLILMHLGRLNEALRVVSVSDGGARGI